MSIYNMLLLTGIITGLLSLEAYAANRNKVWQTITAAPAGFSWAFIIAVWLVNYLGGN